MRKRLNTEIKKNDFKTGANSKLWRKKENKTDLQTQVSFLKYTLCGNQAASVCLCANTLESTLVSHVVLGIHTHPHTQTHPDTITPSYTHPDQGKSDGAPLEFVFIES